MFLAELALKKIGILDALLLGTQHQADFLDATLHQFLKQDEDNGAHHAVGTGNGEEVLLQRTRGGIEARAKACHGDDGFPDGMYGTQGQRIGFHALTVQIVDDPLLVVGTAGQELHRAVAMRTDTLATPHPGLDLRVIQHRVQLGSPQGRRHGGYILVEHLLSLGHQASQRLGIACSHILDGLVYYLVVPFAQGLVQVLLFLCRGKGVGLVQIRQNPDGILSGTQVGKDPVECLLDVERLHLYLVTVKGHQVRLHAEGAGLVQSTAARRGAQFAHVGNVHLAHRIEVQMINLVERTGHQHADGCTRRQAALHGQRHGGDAYAHATNLVPLQHVTGHAGTVAEERPRLGHALQFGLAHAAREVAPHVLQLGGIAIHLEDGGTLHLGIDALFNTCHDGCSGHNVGIHRPIVTCPVSMFAKQTQAAWHKKLYHSPISILKSMFLTIFVAQRYEEMCNMQRKTHFFC